MSIRLSLSPHPEESRSGVSKDGPDVSGAYWSILRDAPAALLRMRAEKEENATLAGRTSR
jgi:hypothetical protein